MSTIEIFTDIGSTEYEINDKYPPLLDLTAYQKFTIWVEKYKLIIVPIMLIVIIYLFDNHKIIKTQNGGGLMSQAASPVSATFGLVTGALGNFIRLIMLIITIIMVPAIPILVYCILAYYIIKRFLFMITTVK